MIEGKFSIHCTMGISILKPRNSALHRNKRQGLAVIKKNLRKNINLCLH